MTGPRRENQTNQTNQADNMLQRGEQDGGFVNDNENGRIEKGHNNPGRDEGQTDDLSFDDNGVLNSNN